jgi:hypothetical protein
MVVCIQPRLEISTPTHARTSKKHDNSQVESGGQLSHRKNLAGNADLGKY